MKTLQKIFGNCEFNGNKLPVTECDLFTGSILLALDGENISGSRQQPCTIS
jgi:hypothetical protein